MTEQRDWNRHTILAELRSRGMTLAGLAERNDIPVSSVKNIWTRPHEKAERAMAEFIGEPVELLFPKRYPKRGNRIFRPVPPKQRPDAPKARQEAA